MATRRITKLSPTQSVGAFDQIGTAMKTLGIWKTREIRELLQPGQEAGISVYGPTVSLEYPSSSPALHSAEIILRGDGTMNWVQCLFCTTEATKPIVWCQHIQYLAATKRDADLYVQAPLGTILIPIVPTKGVFVPVETDLFRTKVHNHQLTEISIKLGNKDDPDADIEPMVMGYLTDAWGISSIRGMVVDFLYGAFDSPKHFHQERDAYLNNTAIGAPLKKVIGLANAKLDPFTHAFYQATYGKTFGEIELAGDPASAAPSF